MLCLQSMTLCVRICERGKATISFEIMFNGARTIKKDICLHLHLSAWTLFVGYAF